MMAAEMVVVVVVVVMVVVKTMMVVKGLFTTEPQAGNTEMSKTDLPSRSLQSSRRGCDTVTIKPAINAYILVGTVGLLGVRRRALSKGEDV